MALEISGQCLHFIRPGGREQKRLSVFSRLTNNDTHLRFKSHVEHTIRLIQHEVCDSPHICDTHLQEID
jgi:hypothetical protein